MLRIVTVTRCLDTCSAWKRTGLKLWRKPHFIQSLSTTTATSQNEKENHFDVLIAGGGVVGCALARLLHESIPTLRIGLLEARDVLPPSSSSSSSSSSPTQTEAIPHPRSYALSPNSLNVLGSQTISEVPLGYYTSMQVWQANSPASLTFTSRDLNADPEQAPYLGACVEDGPLVWSLWNQIQSSPAIRCWTNTTLKDMASVGSHSEWVQVTTNQDETITTALLVGADGSQSWIRKMCGISRIGTEYEHHALTFTVELQSSMNQRAFQRFLPDGGPMALLPTYSPKHAVVVWSTSPSTVQRWKNASHEALVEHLNATLWEGPQRVPPLLERDQDNHANSMSMSVLNNLLYGAERVLDTLHYGLAMASHHPEPKFVAPPRITQIVSPKVSFPLSCFQANSYVKGRVVLAGDAAHTVHPMAGQGLNLGLADVQVLVTCLEKANRAGMDLMTFVQEYESNRYRNVSLSLAGMHALQRIFANQTVPMQHAKTLGMNVVQNFGTLRRQLALAAAHGVSI